MENVSKYDLVIKDLFQRDHPSLLQQWTSGVPVREVLNVELARVEERRADLVFSLADESILHIEFQSSNDPDIAYREGIYCFLLGQKYRRRVRQVVLYIGQPKLHMKNHVDLGETRCSFTLMDIRETDAQQWIGTGRAGDLSLAMLARGGSQQLLEIAKRASELKGRERQRVVAQLVLLSGLRQLTGQLTMELRAMGTSTDFDKNEFVQDAVRNGLVKMLRGQLTTKFGSVPRWVDDRLASATSAQVQRWSKRIFAAATLEGVLGKK